MQNTFKYKVICVSIVPTGGVMRHFMLLVGLGFSALASAAFGDGPAARGVGGSTEVWEAVSGGALTDIDRPLLGGCHPATVRALKEHDPTVDLPNTIAGWNAIWWAKFHGCQEVINLVGPSGMKK